MKKSITLFVLFLFLFTISYSATADSIYESPELNPGINEYGSTFSSWYNTAHDRDRLTEFCAAVIMINAPTSHSSTIINTIINALASDNAYVAKVGALGLGVFFFDDDYLVWGGYLPATDTLNYFLTENSVPGSIMMSSLQSQNTLQSYHKVDGTTCLETIISAISN